MPGNEDIRHSLLIVSGSEQFAMTVRNALPSGKIRLVDCKSSAAAARRSVLEKSYGIVIISAPLPDESGLELALDIAGSGNAGVLIAAPPEVYDSILERGAEQAVLALSRPVQRFTMQTAVRYLIAVQDRMVRLRQETDRALEKAQEIRRIDRAKFILMEKKHLTEDAAHRYIGKLAMDNAVTRLRIAAMIIDKYED